MSLPMNEIDFRFHTPQFSSDQLLVRAFSGLERLSAPFQFDIQLVSELEEVEPAELIGQPATLSLRGQTGTRHVHGLIESFAMTGVGRKYFFYQARLVPTIGILRHRFDSRIFQQKTTVDVVKQVLSDAGLPAEAIRARLVGSYQPRDYLVQYQETDLDFIRRILEEDGIFFFFEHSEEADTFVLADSPMLVKPLPDAAPLPFRDESTATVFEQEFVYRLERSAELSFGTLTLKDFRFKNPAVPLTMSSSSSAFPELESYLFPGGYVEPQLGSTLAKLRLQEAQLPRDRQTCVTTCRNLVPGYRFALEGHPRAALNQEYLLVEVHHEATQTTVMGEEEGAGQAPVKRYRSTISTLPAKVHFRPSRVTARPVVAGVQSAEVVGPAGEEIYCDEFGRVKVQFQWDRQGQLDANSSCWVRVNQPWAGEGFGGISLPRIGQEVLVQFLEGDPDRPVIVGRVYNGHNPVPYGLPANKTRSTWKSNSSPGGNGSNELRFEDLAGSEEVYLHAQKDFNEVTENDHTTLVKHDETCTVDNDRTHIVHHNESITVDVDQTTLVGQNRTETVGSNERITIGANRTEQVGQNETITIGANRAEQVVQNEAVTIGANQSLTVGDNQNITIGKARMLSVGLGYMQNVGLAKMTNIGAAYSLNVGAAMNTVVGLSQTAQIGVGKGTSVGQDYTIDVGESMSITVGKELLITAGDQITISSGKASITLKKDGTITISGKDVTINASGELREEAKGNITMRGKKIKQNG